MDYDDAIYVAAKRYGHAVSLPNSLPVVAVETNHHVSWYDRSEIQTHVTNVVRFGVIQNDGTITPFIPDRAAMMSKDWEIADDRATMVYDRVGAFKMPDDMWML